MGRIVARVTIDNPLEPGRRIETDALVDTGAFMLTLPKAWQPRLGKLATREIEVFTAKQERAKAQIGGPVRIQISGFPQINSEVCFLDMAEEEEPEPLIGYITLEQSQAAVDMVGHRLTHIRYMDMK
jgi:predicted aspartyl protease